MDEPIDNIIRIRWTRPDEKHLFAYSHSIVEAILTCPVWGLIRYVQGVYYPVSNRSLALEAGGAMHDIFAAVRLWQLYRVQGLYGHFIYHANRLLNTRELGEAIQSDVPTGRFASCWKPIDDNPRDELIAFCFKVLNTGDFYDDPDDRVRTLSHMEETIIRYVDDMLPKLERNPIWVADVQDPTAAVGIECVFDVIITWRGKSVRYIGTIDGIVIPLAFGGEFMIDENKTASRLDETWRKSYQVKSQPTGYIAIGKMITGLVGNRVRMIGTKIKQTRSAEDLLSFIEERDDFQMQDWVKSLFFAHSLNEQFGSNPLDAPQFTQSCSRYFRACAFIDLCAAEPEDRVAIYETMVPAELTPSQKAVIELEYDYYTKHKLNEESSSGS